MSTPTEPGPQEDWGTPTSSAPPYRQQEPYQQQQAYQQHAAPSRAWDTSAQSDERGIGWSIGSFVLAAIAIFLIPILFGLGAIVLAVVAMRRGERLGKTALWVSIAATVVGLIVGAMVGATTYSY